MDPDWIGWGDMYVSTGAHLPQCAPNSAGDHAMQDIEESAARPQPRNWQTSVFHRTSSCKSLSSQTNHRHLSRLRKA